jgi:hypothetical protein
MDDKRSLFIKRGHYIIVVLFAVCHLIALKHKGEQVINGLPNDLAGFYAV